MKLIILLASMVSVFIPMFSHANIQANISADNARINAAYLSLQQEKLKMVQATSTLKTAIENCAIKYTNLNECLPGSYDIPNNIVNDEQELTSIEWSVDSPLQGRILVKTHAKSIYHGKNHEVLRSIDDDKHFTWVEICQPNTLCFASRLNQIQKQKIAQVAQIISTKQTPSQVAGIYLTAALSNSDFNRVVTLSTLHSALKLSLKHNDEVIEPIQQFQYTVLDENFKTSNNKFNNALEKIALLQIQISGLFNGEFFKATKKMKLVNLQGYWLVSSFQ